MKTCSNCGVKQDIEEFQPNPRYRDGRSTWCRNCHKAASTKSRKKSAAKDPDYHKNEALRKHRWTPEQYEERLREQSGHCALCPAKTSENGDRLSVDHDHNICPEKYACDRCRRGLLCSTCNAALGYLEALLSESQVIPREGTWTSRALRYLAQYTKETQRCGEDSD